VTKPPKRALTWANRITLLRLLLTPVLVIGLLSGARGWPVLIFLLAALSDVLDGAVARWRGEQTTLGKYLDPIADKLLLSSSYLALAHLQVFPLWVFVVVFSRDLFILIGWNVIYILTRNFTVEPRWLGKGTTFLQMATVVLALTVPGAGILPWALGATVLMTTLSAIDYVWLGSRKLGELG
jgi:cardiolipin synthase